jgi:hypothetical protein
MLDLAFAANRGIDLGAYHFADLNCRNTDTSAGGMDEDGLSTLSASGSFFVG